MPRVERKEVEEPHLNLIPIMNLFTALIPFLLLSAAFFHMSVIKISIPVASESGETDISKEEDKVTLNLQIQADKYKLSASSDTLEPDVLKALRDSIPRSAQATDDVKEAAFAQLSEAAYRIKGGYNASDTVIIAPDDEIPYEEVVEVMDAVRQINREVAGNKQRVKLFGRVVLSGINK